MRAGKGAVIIAWLLFASGFAIAPESGLSGLARKAFWIMLAAHAVEFAVFRGVFAQARGSLGSHLIQTLIFGFFHIQEARAAADRKAA